MKTPIIFCTDASLYFAKKIAENLRISVDPIIAKKFGNGEIYYRIGIEDRTDLFGKDKPDNFDNFMNPEYVAGKVIDNLKQENPLEELVVQNK